MKWSLLIGKAWGTEIRLHWSMLLLIPYTLIAFQPEDLPSALRALFLIVAIFVCVALHELGHTLAARLYGIKVTNIILWPLGGFANLASRPEKVLPDLVISAAGPLVNLFIFSALLLLTVLERLLESAMIFPALSQALRSADVFPFLAGLSIMNLGLAVFNLVPIYPLDGGQITRGLLKLVIGEKWADRAMLVISLPLSLALTGYGFFSRDVLIILTGLLLLLAGSTLNVRLFNSLMLAGLYFIDRGGYYLKRSDFDPALRQYTRAIAASPNRSGLYVSRAIVFMNLLDFARARVDVTRAIELDKNNFVAWALQGELNSLEKQYDQALAAYNRAIEIRPNWNVSYLDRSSVHQEQGRLEQALSDINHSIDLAHGSAINHLHRSILRHQMGDLPGAQRDADLALRYAPHWMLVFPEIFVLGLKDHLNWALDYYWRAIERMPGAYQAYQGRADACRINGRLDWAVADYDRAIRLAPRQADLYLARGCCFLQSGFLEQATADLQQAARLAHRSHIRRKAEDLLIQAQSTLVAAPEPSPTGEITA